MSDDGLVLFTEVHCRVKDLHVKLVKVGVVMTRGVHVSIVGAAWSTSTEWGPPQCKYHGSVKHNDREAINERL